MTREQYTKLYRRYHRMNDEDLTSCLSVLASKRFDEHNTDVLAEHRIAARVQLERKRSGEGLIFHMKEFQVKKSC